MCERQELIQAHNGSFNLMILGTHGISHVIDHPLGSFSEKIVQTATRAPLLAMSW